MLGEMTTQEFFEILTRLQCQICGMSVGFTLIVTAVFWIICDIASKLLDKLSDFFEKRKKERSEYYEEE